VNDESENDPLTEAARSESAPAHSHDSDLSPEDAVRRRWPYRDLPPWIGPGES